MYTTGSIPPPGPLSYAGQVVVPFIMREFDPQTTFNQFPVPTIWVNTLTSMAWILVSKALGVAVWLPLGGGGGDLDTITTPDSVVVIPTAGNINFANGTGMDITGSGDTVTFNAVGGALTWTVVTALTQAVANNHGYIANNAAGVTFTLPATSPVGTVIGITTIHSGGWTIAQRAGQKIQIGDVATTIGVGGSLSSTMIGDTVIMVCTQADTDFLCYTIVGNITKV